MRFPRSILLLVSACLALPILPVTSTAAPVADSAAGDPPRSARAEETLAAVRAAFSGDAAPGRRQAADGRELTLLLAALRRRLDDLAPRDRLVARSFLARPTDRSDPYVRYSRDSRPTNDCRVAPTEGSKVCIHWARRTSHAPSKADTDRDRVPNQVERTRNVANHVWERIVVDGGYRRPPRDDEGPNRRLDIYLADIGDQGLYGYCVPEDRIPGGRAYTGYCVVDDDYTATQFPSNTPNQNLKVTVAHEFFHAVQFGYDADEAAWFMEGSAAWVEDEIYDGVDDNHIYLPTSPLARPDLPLDHAPFGGLSVYGSWIFWRFLTERYDAAGGTGLPLLMRRMWEDADQRASSSPGHQAMGALRRELDRQGASLPETYADFSAANLHPGTARHGGRPVYEEGAAYERHAASPAVRRTLTQAAPTVTGSRSVDHLASSTIRLTPGSDLGAGRILHLVAGDGGLGDHAAVRVGVVGTDGSLRQVSPTRTTGGWRITIADFAAVRYVELTLVNGMPSGSRVAMSYEAAVQPA